MKLSLVVMQDSKEGKEIPVKLTQFVIGRDPQCHLRPASTLISKRHCAFLIREGKVFLRDFDSTNGTIVNKEALKGELQIHNGDEVQIGPLIFRVKLEAGVAVDTPTPMPPTAVKVAAHKPVPAKTAAAGKPGPADTDEDTFADMLLHIPDDPNASTQTLSGSDGISPDSTIFQMPTVAVVPDAKKEEVLAAVAASESLAKPKADEAKKKALHAATSDAAKSILEKYMKRPKPGAR